MTGGGSIFGALVLADARTPTGAHSHSSGLEPAIVAGLGVEDIYPFMLARLSTTGRLEAGAAALACTLAGSGADADAYRGLEDAVAARTPSSAQRTASVALGRGLLRFGRSVRPDDLGLRELATLDAPPSRPVVLGVLGAAFGQTPATCAEICCYDDLQSIASAALKLLPADPLRAAGWVLDAAAAVSDVVAEAELVRHPTDLPAFSAPLIELWSEEHTTRTRRLFVA